MAHVAIAHRSKTALPRTACPKLRVVVSGALMAERVATCKRSPQTKVYIVLKDSSLFYIVTGRFFFKKKKYGEKKRKKKTRSKQP